ncbi:MAG: response regulator [Saprospiraceae bacterium]|jgi:DNA-binding LytR/AlgR family response regulator|nr:response regulator [Saprospiraceae bacterium]MBP6568917.1 response regulator [Saprospiraceae bacterium]
MKSNIKIGIVEDELIIAEKINMILGDLGYEVCETVTNFTDAIKLINSDKPDILLLDIQLAGEKDGIDIAQHMRKHYNVPFIFLTANSDDLTLARAKEVRPWAYIVKPFSKEDLFTCIEIVLSNYKDGGQIHTGESENKSFTQKDFIFIKDGHAFRKLYLNQIHYLKSDANYVTAYIEGGRKMMVRDKLDDFMKQLDAKYFIRIHRSFAVNIQLVDGVYPNEITIDNTTIPVGKSYRQELLTALGLSPSR